MSTPGKSGNYNKLLTNFCNNFFNNQIKIKGKSVGTKSGANSSKSSGKKKKEISTGIGRFPVPKKYNCL